MSPDLPPDDFTRHGPFTRPGRHAAGMAALPTAVDALLETIAGLLIHGGYLGFYGLREANFPPFSRETLAVEDRLDQVSSASDAPLSAARPPEGRAVGTCRDFALMTCAALREKSVPARVRCGFARYFRPGDWEDHWVCEYWRADDGRWALADAQLDPAHRERLGVTFPPADVPRHEYATAAEAWRMHREDGEDAGRFGHGEFAGEWFLRVNLARDCLALAGCEISPWDGWRDAAGREPPPGEAGRRTCDEIADAVIDVDSGPAALTRLRARADGLVPFW